MKKLSFGIALAGIFILGLLMFKLKVVEVNSFDDLEELEINTKVELEGRVIEERALYEGTKMFIIGDIEVICECLESFKGKEIRITGMIEEFNGKKQVRALRIEVLD
jgi:hypothetical protein